jgi:hypothetical protein
MHHSIITLDRSKEKLTYIHYQGLFTEGVFKVHTLCPTCSFSKGLTYLFKTIIENDVKNT